MKQRFPDTITIGREIRPIAEKLLEVEKEALLVSMNKEAQAWETWKQEWKPSLWDRFYIWLNRPQNPCKTYDRQERCRELFLKSRPKPHVPR